MLNGEQRSLGRHNVVVVATVGRAFPHQATPRRYSGPPTTSVSDRRAAQLAPPCEQLCADHAQLHRQDERQAEQEKRRLRAVLAVRREKHHDRPHDALLDEE